MKKVKTRDIEKNYSKKDFIKKIRRFIRSLEQEKTFSIQIKGHKITAPKNAIINIEHEKTKNEEEIEFQIKWKL